MKVDNISQDIEEFRAMIEPIKALLGGTNAMREAGKAYLPKFKAETDRDYERRLSVATLTPYFEDTIKSMSGRVFYKQFALDSVNEKIKEFANNFTLTGRSMSGLFESVFFEALSYSRSYVVVDYSSTTQANTAAEEKQLGARPYAFKVGADQVLDVRKNKNGITLFKYIHEVVDEANTDEFEINYLDEIVLMTPGLTKFYRKNANGTDWVLYDKVSIKVGGKGYQYVLASELKLAKKPPLANLAELNIKHWQSQSEQDNILSTARIPILKLKGVDSDKELLVQGALILPKDGDAAYIEHSGAAIEAGQSSLNKLEEQMAVAGSKLLMRTKMALTDTQAKSEGQKEVSELMLYGMMLNDFINDVIGKFGMWLGVQDAGLVDITDNLQSTIDSDVSYQDMILAVNNRIISRQTAFESLKSRNAINDDADFDEEQERIEREGIGEVESNV